MKRFFLLTLLTICFALPCHAENTGLLILLGVDDSEPTQWDGQISVSEGAVGDLSGWRFEKDDTIKGKAAWTCSTHHLQVKPGRANNPKKLGMAKRAKQMQGPMQDNGVVAKLVNVSNATEVKLVTPQGEVIFKLSDVTYGKRVPLLDGRVAVCAQRVVGRSRWSGPTMTSPRSRWTTS